MVRLTQLEIGAFKECVNSLSQAVAYSKGTENKRKAYWLALLGYARFSYGDIDAAHKLSLEAMIALNDPTFTLQKRSKMSIEKMRREYEEMDDIPTSEEGKFDYVNKTKILLCVQFSELFGSNGCMTLRRIAKEQYGFSVEELIPASEWYRLYGLISAFKQNNIDVWYLLHVNWPAANKGKIMEDDAGAVRRIYRRLGILHECLRLKPHFRAEAVCNPYYWYPMLAPEMVKNSLPRLQGSLSLIEGNLKYSGFQIRSLLDLGLAHASLGNIKLFKHYQDRLQTVKFDSEALEDQKAFGYQVKRFVEIYLGTVNSDAELICNSYDKLINMKKLFPNTKSNFPLVGYMFWGLRAAVYGQCLRKDWDAAEKMVLQMYSFSRHGLEGLMYPGWLHLEVLHTAPIEAILMVYLHTRGKPDVDPRHAQALPAIRKGIEMLATINPGLFRCGLQVYVARITLMLEDRP
eukprot:g3826.t1